MTRRRTSTRADLVRPYEGSWWVVPDRTRERPVRDGTPRPSPPSLSAGARPSPARRHSPGRWSTRSTAARRALVVGCAAPFGGPMSGMDRPAEAGACDCFASLASSDPAAGARPAPTCRAQGRAGGVQVPEAWIVLAGENRPATQAQAVRVGSSRRRGPGQRAPTQPNREQRSPQQLVRIRDSHPRPGLGASDAAHQTPHPSPADLTSARAPTGGAQRRP